MPRKKITDGKSARTLHKEDIRDLARLHLSNIDLASWFGVNPTIFSKEPFITLIHQAKSETKQMLIRKALHRALNDNSDTMLIFCLKNICKWNNNDSALQEGAMVETAGFTINVLPKVDRSIPTADTLTGTDDSATD